MKKAGAVILFIVCAYFVYAQSELLFRDIPLQQALDLSVVENRPVLFMCYEDWCGHCEKMLNEVFTDTALISFYSKNFICVKMDMTTGEGPKYVKKFSVTSYPTFVVLDKNGETIYQFAGEYKANDFIMHGQTALITENQIPYLRGRFENNLSDSGACYAYLKALTRGRLPTQDAVNLYFRHNKNNFGISSGNWKILSTGVSDIESEPFQFILSHQKEFGEAVTEKKVDRKIYLTTAYNLQSAGNANDTATYKRKKIIAAGFQLHFIDSLIFVSDLGLYERNKMWPQFIRTALSGTETYVWNDYVELRHIADMFLQHATIETLYIEGAGYAKRSSEIRSEYGNTILAAKLFVKGGDKISAYEMAVKAKDIAKKMQLNMSEVNLVMEQCGE
ncbi:MAG: thioredoxin fold domain-containing protein [Chitinophagales bacterium]|nr:thioredoxin fold domain-containing protein [Chitinophagales bacterium]